MSFWVATIIFIVAIYIIYSIVRGFLLTQKCKRILKRRRMLIGGGTNGDEKDMESGDSGGL